MSRNNPLWAPRQGSKWWEGRKYSEATGRQLHWQSDFRKSFYNSGMSWQLMTHFKFHHLLIYIGLEMIRWHFAMEDFFPLVWYLPFISNIPSLDYQLMFMDLKRVIHTISRDGLRNRQMQSNVDNRLLIRLMHFHLLDSLPFSPWHISVSSPRMTFLLIPSHNSHPHLSNTYRQAGHEVNYWRPSGHLFVDSSQELQNSKQIS